MKRSLSRIILAAAITGLAIRFSTADTQTTDWSLNAPVVGAGGDSVIHWGRIVSQSSIQGSNKNNHSPQKWAGTSITADGQTYCQNSNSGPFQSTEADPEIHCNWANLPVPQINFLDFKAIAQLQNGSCSGGPCLNAKQGGVLDYSCTVGGFPKVWYYEGDATFNSNSYFCGILVSEGKVTFRGNGAGNLTVTPPSDGWKQYEAMDTSASGEYPGDSGLHQSNTPVNVRITFQGYIYATTGYDGGGGSDILGAIQFGNGVSSNGGGSNIYFSSQTIFIEPPAGQVNEPIIFPNGACSAPGTSVTVTILDTTSGASIYYTVDGSIPDASHSNATLYSGPLSVSANTTIIARAYASGMTPSAATNPAIFTFASSCGVPPPPPPPPACGDLMCNGTETCSSCALDCGACPPPPPPPPSAQIQFNPTSYSVNENDGMTTITVTRTVETSGTSTVQFASADGTASSGLDYSGISGTLTFSPGDTSKTFDVPVLSDRLTEGSETVLLTLSSPIGASLGVNQAVLTIQDQTPTPPPAPNPLITALMPYSAPVNFGSDFPMRIVGTDFDATGAQVIWNGGTNLTVVSRSATEIVATVTANLVTTVGTYPVMVRNPGPLDSNSVDFTVRSLLSGNAPPWVTSGPSTNPNPTFTRNTTVSVRGDTYSCNTNNVCGEALLTYTWTLVGINPSMNVTFSNNGTHAGRDSVVAFPGPGTYHLRVRVRDSVTQFAVDSDVLDVSVVSKAVSLTLSPKSQTMTPDQTPTITAAVLDQFGTRLNNPSLTWTSSAGTLSKSQTTAILTVDSSIRTAHITAALDNSSLSDFADFTIIIGVGGVGDLSTAKAYPVPFKAGAGSTEINFTNLLPGTRIRIFTMTGHIVQTLDSPDGSDKPWNIKNANFENVASGVYMYIIEAAGQKKEGKLVIIK